MGNERTTEPDRGAPTDTQHDAGDGRRIATSAGTDFEPAELVGAAVQRSEDPHLITGDAAYTDDLQYSGEVHLAICRSPYGHARVEGIDAAAAQALEGVLAVYTAADIEASDCGGTLRSGSTEGRTPPDQPLLARDHVTYQGQPIAGVVASDRYTAHTGVDRLDVTYERQPAVTEPAAALESDAATIHADAAPDNVAFEWDAGDEAAVDAAFERADTKVTANLEINRVVPTAMEPRAAVARYSPPSEELTVELSTQNPHRMRGDLAETLGVAEQQIRVRAPDVGGGFGAKLQPYTGYMLAAWAAMQLERPVKWVATRSEDIESMVHSRHHLVEAAVAVNDDGRIQGLRADTVAPVGGYLVSGGMLVPTNLGVMATGQYDIPAAYVRTTGAYTNTAPMSAYRGAGRPEATYVIERLVRIVAAALEMDPVTVRRRNAIQPAQFPYDNGLGRTYDSGDYEATMDVALERVDYEAFRERQAAAREAGLYLGIGLSNYVEACGAAPGWDETGSVAVTPEGEVVVDAGTAEIGTGHRTGYAQIVAGELGVPFDAVAVREGDTARTDEGGGTAGSRAMPVAGSAVRESAAAVREQAKRIAAHQLEAAPADIDVADGKFAIRGARERAISIEAVATLAHDPDALPPDLDPGLAASTDYDPPNYTFPFGTHVAIVEVDPATGDVAIERYLGVDDVGTQINPKIVEGQIHGGVVQGIGQALFEGTAYDDNGTLQGGSLQDYAIPKAHQLPEMETAATVTECPHNPLGVKGVGEAGAIAAPPAVVNAVVDALEPFGVEDLSMPLTAERIWRAVAADA